jgi:hypothetical protein
MSPFLEAMYGELPVDELLSNLTLDEKVALTAGEYSSTEGLVLVVMP